MIWFRRYFEEERDSRAHDTIKIALVVKPPVGDKSGKQKVMQENDKYSGLSWMTENIRNNLSKRDRIVAELMYVKVSYILDMEFNEAKSIVLEHVNTGDLEIVIDSFFEKEYGWIFFILQSCTKKQEIYTIHLLETYQF